MSSKHAPHLNNVREQQAHITDYHREHTRTSHGRMWETATLFVLKRALLCARAHAAWTVTWDACLIDAGQSACEWHCPRTQTCGMCWERGETRGSHGNRVRSVEEKRRYRRVIEMRGGCEIAYKTRQIGERGKVEWCEGKRSGRETYREHRERERERKGIEMY